MGLEGILLIALVVLTVYAYHGLYNMFYLVQPIPKFETTWWGPGIPLKENLSITPFQINVSEEVLFDLENRLRNHRPLTPPLDGMTHEYGLNTHYFANIMKYWTTEYNWTERENKLNRLPQYTTKIQGLNIHFIHIKPNDDSKKLVPLLLLHSWPHTNMEFAEAIPFLTRTRNTDNHVLEIIAPSLPGFGFSDKTRKPGLGVVQMGVLLNNFMKRLGRRYYYVHGEGWGGVIAENMALLYPDRVLGVHSNWCMALKNTAYLKMVLGVKVPWLTEKQHFDKMYPVSKKFPQLIEESVYSYFQFIKPDTIGIGLSESPAGLASYITDMFASLLRYNARRIEKDYDKILLKYSYDKLLDNIMIYWVTESITTSMRIYAEYYRQYDLISKMNKHYIKTPFVCSRLQSEVMFQSTAVLKERYENLIEVLDMPLTTRFVASEEPQYLATEIKSSIVKFLQYHSTIKKDSKLKSYASDDL